MKCNDCGTEFKEGIFCPECGAKNENIPSLSESEKEIQEKAREEKEHAERERQEGGKQQHMNNDTELKIMELVDKITKQYDKREERIPELARSLGISTEDVQKTLIVCNYFHTIKRNSDNALPGKLVNGVTSPDKFPFLNKYIDKEQFRNDDKIAIRADKKDEKGDI